MEQLLVDYKEIEWGGLDENMLSFDEFNLLFPNDCYCMSPADNCDTGYTYHDEFAECDVCLYTDVKDAYEHYKLGFEKNEQK